MIDLITAPLSDPNRQLNEMILQINAADATLTSMSEMAGIGAAASVPNISIPVSTTAIWTTGYATVGDGGHALYKRAASEPAHAGKIRSKDSAWWEIVWGDRINALSFGADPSGTASSSTAINNAIAFANTFATAKAVYIPQGRYLISTTISLSGNNSLEGDGALQSVLIPTMTDGTACVRVTPFNTFWAIRNLGIISGMNIANFVTGTAAPNCIGIDASNSVAGYDTRYRIDNIAISGCAIGWKQVGWIGDATKVHIEYCTLGFSGDQVNASNLGLRFESCRQSYVITNSFGLLLPNLYDESDVANSVASTIDACRAITIPGAYFEAGVTHPRTVPFVIIGGTTINYDIEVLGLSIAGSTGLVAGVYPVSLDKVTSGKFYAVVQEGTQLRTISSTSSTTDIEMQIITGSGGAIHDGSQTQDRVINYFPNPNFEGGFKGWDALVVTRATAAAEATIVRRGNNAMKLTCTAGAGFNYAQWQINGDIPLKLRGKTVRMGAWVWVPNIAAYADAARTLFPSILVSSFNGAVLVTGSDTSQKLANNAWNYITSKVVLQADATQIQLNVYANQSSNVPAGTEFVVVSDITLVEDTCLMQDQRLGRYHDSDMIPKFVQGNMILMGTATPTDANQNFLAGDQVWKTNPAGAASPGWVCTTAGTGATAVWKTMAVLGA